MIISLFFSVLYKQFKVVSEVLERLCNIADKLIVFDAAVVLQRADDETFILFDFIDVLDDTLIELFVLNVADIRYLDLLYLFVF